MRIALCQYESITDDIASNLQTVFEALESDADVIVFPEMFLTGYLSEDADRGSIDYAVQALCSATEETGRCVIVGGPEYDGDDRFNSAYIIRDSVESYRKIHLPDFPPFSEKSAFSPGSAPKMFEHGGLRFGVCICYDVFFPELMKTYSLNGADVIICISASPVTSKQAFERTLPARAVENTTYLLFVNNTCVAGDLEFFGESRALLPNGDVAAIIETEEGMAVVEIDESIIREARRKRPVIEDTVAKIVWQ